MKIKFMNKISLVMAAVSLAILVSGVGFWQYQSAGAVSIRSSDDYVSINASLAPSSGSSESSPDDNATPEVSQKSASYFEIDYPGTGSKIGIGDVSKTGDFKPDLSVSTWDNEAGFQLIASGFTPEESQFTTSLNDGKISASNNGWIFEYKPTELKEGFNDQGGLDILITAKEKPSSNSLDFTFQSDTVTPYLQPPLTAEYKDGWSDEYQADIRVTETQVLNATDGAILKERPDYVVNSIAFYADAKADGVTNSTGKDYKTGKVGHLYRMKAIDAQSNSAWFDWAISSENQIKLIDSTGFLETASYPVVIQPLGDTFGYTTVGASWNAGLNRMFMEKAAPASNGTLTSINVYITQTWSGNPVKCALYNHSTSALVATTEEKTSSAITGWLTFNVNGTPSVSNGTNYWVLFWGSGSAWVRFAYDSGGAPYGSAAWRDETYGSYPDPLGTLNYQYSHDSFYATYTPSGSLSISNTPSSYNFGPVDTSATISTGLNYFTVTNNSGSAVNITIGGTDVTGGTTWTLSDAGTPGSTTYAMKAGLNDGSYNIVVKKTAPYNTLKANLANNASQGWGLQFLAPTTYTDSIQKTGTVTLTAASP